VAVSALDRRALRHGAAVALVLALPFAIGAAAVNGNDESSPWVAVLWLAALGGFVLGAGIAAWVQATGYPISHGIVCAAGTYLAAQGAFTVVRLVRGEQVSWLGLFFTLTMVTIAGMVGGAIGGALRRRGIVPGALHDARPQREGGSR
jgi:hypothetical protein